MPKSGKKKRLSSASDSPRSSKRRKGELHDGHRTASINMAETAENQDLQVLKAWITEREAAQHPLPLTDLQKRLVSELKKTITRVPEPELGDIDWVSILHRHRDAHRKDNIVVLFEDAPAPDNQWYTFCKFSWSRDSISRVFPGPEGGLLPVSFKAVPEAPSFARKKDAKRYAAKCCVKWLLAIGHMPAKSVPVNAFPLPSIALQQQQQPPPSLPPKPISANHLAALGLPPKPQAVVVENTAPARQQSTAFSPESTAEENSSGGAPIVEEDSNNNKSSAELTNKSAAKKGEGPPTIAKGGSGCNTPVDVRDEDIPPTKRVTEVCRRLGVAPPKYEIETQPQTNGSYLFDGMAVMGPLETVQLPDTVGRVRGIRSKVIAKETMAEDVLRYLLNVEAMRLVMFDSMVAEDDAARMAALERH